MILENLLLDFDGVIVDSEYDSLNAWQQLIAVNYKKQVSFSIIYQFCLGFSFELAHENLKKHLKISNFNISRKDWINTILDLSNGEIQACEGVLELIDTAYDNELKLFLVSSSSPKWIQQASELANINLSKFTGVIDRTLVSKPKPNSEAYLKCLSKYKLNAKNCLAVEDSLPGIQSALNAGISTCGFTGGKHYSHTSLNSDTLDTSLKPTLQIISRFSELLKSSKSL